MKKVIYCVAVAVLLAGLFLGCAPTPEAKRVIYATGQPGDLRYERALAQAQVITEYSDLTVTVMPLPAIAQLLHVVTTGDADLMVTHTETMYAWTHGVIEYEEQEPTPGLQVLQMGEGTPRAIWVVNPDIKTVSDLRGKRVAAMFLRYGGDFDVADEAAVRSGGLDPEKDIIMPKYDTLDDALADLYPKKVDAVIGYLSEKRIAEMQAFGGFKILPIDGEAIDRELAKMGERAIGSGSFIMPGGRFPGFPEPFVSFGQVQGLLCHERLDDEIAYTIVKTLIEHQDELIKASVGFKEWGIERAVTLVSTLPYHKGAIKYYKEMGVWTSELEARQQQLLGEIAALK